MLTLKVNHLSNTFKVDLEDHFWSHNMCFPRVHSPHEIIGTVCDFPYKIIKSAFSKMFLTSLLWQNNATKRVVDISYELHFLHT